VSTLLAGPRRFNDLQDEVSGIAPNILSARLRHLEQQGLVLAAPYCERPPRFVYELTDAGRGLAGVLRMLADWGRATPSAPSRPATSPAGTSSRRAGTARAASCPSTRTTRATCTTPSRA